MEKIPLFYAGQQINKEKSLPAGILSCLPKGIFMSVFNFLL